jgi:hypothetical protein
MPSHGGSRLNASKPEANPKTRYPTHLQISSTPVFRRGSSTPKEQRPVRIHDLQTVSLSWISQKGSMY